MTRVLAHLVTVSVCGTLPGVAAFPHDFRGSELRAYRAASIRDTEKGEFDNDAFDEKPKLPEPPIHCSAAYGLARTAARRLQHGRVLLDHVDLGNWPLCTAEWQGSAAEW